MKILQNKRVLATLALLVAGFLGGLTPVATKIVLRELSPLEVLFWRLSIMLVFYLVLGLRYIQLVWARRLP
ncbi:MAG: hypothetical protein Q7S76_01105, partial [bacterium]|nr:hypothetical protein [bacterium]